MIVREDTIKEMTAADIKNWVDRLTQAIVKTAWKELAKRAAAIKTRYDALSEGTRYGYAAAIMLPEEYIACVKGLDVAWTFVLPDLPETYDPAIRSQNAVTIAKRTQRGTPVERNTKSTLAWKM